MELLYTIGIIIFAIFGAILSIYIAKIKNEGKSLTCALGSTCDEVVHSRFSKFLGFKNEVIGIAYYVAVSVFYIAMLLFTIQRNIIFYVILITSFAFLFNLHLVFTQLFVLRKWCTTCLWSSASSFFIVVFSFLGFQASFGDYLFSTQDIFKWVFFFTVLVGVSMVSFHTKTFIKFLRDFTISKSESKKLAMYSHIGWIAITLNILSGVALVLTDTYGDITEGSKFVPMIMILIFLIIYEIVVNMFIGPKLIDVHFGDHSELEDHYHSYLRKAVFAFIGIGIVSWYILLLLSIFSFYQYTSLAIILFYVIALILIVSLMLYIENLYYKRSVLVYETVEEIEIGE